MPKIKTNRGAAKRFRVTGSGKVKAKKAFTRHILTSKSRKTKRNLRGTEILQDCDTPRVKKLIPYK